MHMGHHLCWPLYKSEPKQSLHLTFHRLWPNKFLVIISATTFGGLGNKQWIYLIWLQWDLNCSCKHSDSLLTSRGLWDIIYKITRLLSKSWASSLHYTTPKHMDVIEKVWKNQGNQRVDTDHYLEYTFSLKIMRCYWHSHLR